MRFSLMFFFQQFLELERRKTVMRWIECFDRLNDFVSDGSGWFFTVIYRSFFIDHVRLFSCFINRHLFAWSQLCSRQLTETGESDAFFSGQTSCSMLGFIILGSRARCPNTILAGHQCERTLVFGSLGLYHDAVVLSFLSSISHAIISVTFCVYILYPVPRQ